jgi:hypothetical protein
MRALLFIAALAAAEPVPVRVTTYAAPSERDFGGAPTRRVSWKSPLDGRVRSSLFVAGFVDRDADDPRLPGVSGVAMEGSGFIEPALHSGDAELASLLRRGWRVLVLERWDEKKRAATFTLAREPLAADGRALKAGLSAAVREGNALFPRGRRVRLVCGGKPFGERLIHDECSSCEGDRHIDLYVAASTAPAAVPDLCTAELLPPGQ